MLSLKVLYVFLALFSAICFATEVAQCKGTKGKSVMTEGFVGDCVAPPCAVKKGEKTWINMTFTSDDNYSKLSNNIYGTIMGTKHGYPGLNGLESCKFITPACPLKKGETYKYAIQLEVKKSFPKVSVPLHFAIKDDGSGKDIACFECVVKIV